jgi:hypothetical protein
LLSKAQNQVKPAEYLQKHEKGPIFAMSVLLSINLILMTDPESLKINGYCFYDPKREQDERYSFYQQLFDTLEKLKLYRPQTGENRKRLDKEW